MPGNFYKYDNDIEKSNISAVRIFCDESNKIEILHKDKTKPTVLVKHEIAKFLSDAVSNKKLINEHLISNIAHSIKGISQKKIGGGFKYVYKTLKLSAIQQYSNSFYNTRSICKDINGPITQYVSKQPYLKQWFEEI